MNKTIVSFGTFVLMGLLANPAWAVITGSKHDFSSKGWSTGNQICVACHTPHNASSVQLAPLWNHVSTTATFSLYTGPTGTLDAVTGQPTGVSKACLSCHDGTVAINSFGGATGSLETITGNALLGTDLSNDHPVSFTYDAALATTDGQLANPSASSGLGGTIQDDMLFTNKMECASCHDVHNSASLAKLLVKSNSNSALCLTCHTK